MLAFVMTSGASFGIRLMGLPRRHPQHSQSLMRGRSANVSGEEGEDGRVETSSAAKTKRPRL
jgi:hypothetical protein